MGTIKQKFKIEDGIPIPGDKRALSPRMSELYEVMRKMRVGQSFFVSHIMKSTDYNNVRSAMYSFSRRMKSFKNYKFALRKRCGEGGMYIEPPEYRCWRIEDGEAFKDHHEGLMRSSRAKKKPPAEPEEEVDMVEEITIKPPVLNHKSVKKATNKRAIKKQTLKIARSVIDPVNSPGSLSGKIYTELVVEGEPMSVTEIIVAMDKDPDDEHFYELVEKLLDDLVKDKNTFNLVDGFYGLKKWE